MILDLWVDQPEQTVLVEQYLSLVMRKMVFRISDQV